MAKTLDFGYLATPIGILNIAEIISLIIALICVGFTSRLYCELADNLQWIYPDLSTLTVRSVFQTFSTIFLIVTILILLVYAFGILRGEKTLSSLNQLCLILNIIMGLVMIALGICAALWEDKLRQTPAIIRRGYLSNDAHFIFNEKTYARPGAAAAAATFAFIAGILFLIEAIFRILFKNSSTNLASHPKYTISSTNERFSSPNPVSSERIIPIETTTAPTPYRV